MGEGALGVSLEAYGTAGGEVVLLEGGLYKLVYVALSNLHPGGGEAAVKHLLQVSRGDLTITIGIVDLEEETLLVVVRDVAGLVLVEGKANNELSEVDTAAAIAITCGRGRR